MKQSTCEHDGFVVVYEGWGKCPVCTMKEELDEALSENEDDDNEIEELKGKIKELKGQVEDLQFELENKEDEEDE